MALFVLITGFGNPHWEHKLTILENNLKKITAYPWAYVDITICQFEDPNKYKIPQVLIDTYKLNIKYEAGIVGHFIKRWANPVTLKGYDYVLLLLDDIELINMDFKKLLSYQKEFGLDILSPCLTLDSKYQYKYLLHMPSSNVNLKIASVCEYFCMFFPISSFSKYYEHVHEDNPWMWGLDLVLHKHLGMKIGILNTMQMKHWYKSESYELRPDADPAEGYHRCIKRYGETPDSLANQIAIRYYIIETPIPP
jgi:hypothetical protein